MKCPNCNFDIAENSKFCPECGEKIHEEVDTTAEKVLKALTTEECASSNTAAKKHFPKKVKMATIIGGGAIALIALTLILIFVVFKHEHTWVYEVQREATYNETGVNVKSCTGCDEVEYLTIRMLSFDEMIASITNADKAVAAYNSLTYADKEDVLKVSKVITAMKPYSSDTRVRDIIMEATAKSAFNNFHSSLKNNLINTNSYTVNSQTAVSFFDEESGNYYLCIRVDYSAQNKAGGYTRYQNNSKYFIWDDDKWTHVPYHEDYRNNTIAALDLQERIAAHEFDTYKTYNFRYSAN